MLSTFLTLYAGSVMSGNIGLPVNLPTVIAWQNQIVQEQNSPQKNPYYIAPVIEAKAAIAVDFETGAILYEKNSHEPLPIASITKLMTALIIAEEDSPTSQVTISHQASIQEGSKLWLKEGQVFTVEDLLYATIIASANDATYALAEHNSQQEEAFVQKMNQKSAALGMKSTHFITPTGLYDEYSDNISTAYDLFILARTAFDKPLIKKAAGIYEYSIQATHPNEEYSFTNRNELLRSYLKVLGLKTGTTDRAGECLVAVIENSEGDRIITVLINSRDRYSETKILADWIFRAYKWD